MVLVISSRSGWLLELLTELTNREQQFNDIRPIFLFVFVLSINSLHHKKVNLRGQTYQALFGLLLAEMITENEEDCEQKLSPHIKVRHLIKQTSLS